MDEATLLANRDVWVTEATQALVRVPFLNPDEALLYGNLVSDRWGSSVRLEQERLPWDTVVASLTRMTEQR